MFSFLSLKDKEDGQETNTETINYMYSIWLSNSILDPFKMMYLV